MAAESGAESGADAAGRPALGGAVAAAKARLARGDPAGCLALLAALPAALHGETCVRQLQAVCQVQQAGAGGSQRWWEVSREWWAVGSSDYRLRYRLAVNPLPRTSKLPPPPLPPPPAAGVRPGPCPRHRL